MIDHIRPRRSGQAYPTGGLGARVRPGRRALASVLMAALLVSCGGSSPDADTDPTDPDSDDSATRTEERLPSYGPEGGGITEGATVSSVATRLAPDPDPYELSWAPPPLTDPQTVFVGADDVVSLDDGRDYRVVFPASPVRHGVVVTGGRNVVIIGGEINIPWQGEDPHIYERRGLLLRGQTGTIHVEGLLITGPDLSEGINIDAPDAIVQLQNLHVGPLRARDQVDFTDNHPDVIQAWGGVGELRVDRMTATSDYQGIFLKEDFGPIGPSTLRRVHIAGEPTARYLYWNDDNFDILVDRSYVTPAQGRSLESTLWPNPEAWPGLNVGSPPGGDFVPTDLAGIGYEPWPYADG